VSILRFERKHSLNPQNLGLRSQKLLHLFALHPIDGRPELHIITEEKAQSDFRDMETVAQIHGVPIDFKTTRAKYKTRALEWFRRTNISVLHAHSSNWDS